VNCGAGVSGRKKEKKGARGVAQEVECLPCKHEALSSQKKKKKRGDKEAAAGKVDSPEVFL
jgi:hypothetical protein